MTDRCPICGKSARPFRHKVRGDKPIKVYRCQGCDLDYLGIWDDEKTTLGFYDNNNYVYKSNYTGHKANSDEYRKRFELVSPHLNRETRLLDIGCGDGTFLKMIKPYVKAAEGTEKTSIHAQMLKKQGYKVWHSLTKDVRPESPYDIICMFAVLEHIPKAAEFLRDLKARFTHKNTQIFIITPHLLDPLVSCYDVPEYRDFFYREYHLYYFTEKSMGRLLEKTGFQFEIKPVLQASLTNHFHWMHKGHGQANTTDMSNVVLPKSPLMSTTPSGRPFHDVLSKVDNYYRELLCEEKIGDLLFCRAWIKRPDLKDPN